MDPDATGPKVSPADVAGHLKPTNVTAGCKCLCLIGFGGEESSHRPWWWHPAHSTPTGALSSESGAACRAALLLPHFSTSLFLISPPISPFLCLS